jgi:hypothetical protein
MLFQSKNSKALKEPNQYYLNSNLGNNKINQCNFDCNLKIFLPTINFISILYFDRTNQFYFSIGSVSKKFKKILCCPLFKIAPSFCAFEGGT